MDSLKELIIFIDFELLNGIEINHCMLSLSVTQMCCVCVWSADPNP